MSSNTSSYPYEEGEESSGGPSINENWASPSELLEMRTMWSAIVTQHKAEMTAMQAALERSHQQQKAYLQELKETHRLRHLYASAAADQEKIVEERKVWAEEKLLMQQEMQRLKLALMKAEASNSHSQHLRHRQADHNNINNNRNAANDAGTTGSGPSDTTTATSWTSTTMPSVPSSASPAGSSSTETYINSPQHQAVLLAVAQEENVALHEALSRLARERSELEQRLQFVTTATSMQHRALRTQTETQSADLVRFQKKIDDLVTDVQKLSVENVSLRDEKMDLEVHVKTLETTVQELKTRLEREKAVSVSTLDESIAEVRERLECAHAAQISALQKQLADANSARENLRSQVEHGILSKSASSQASQQRIDELEETVAELRQALRRIEDEALTVSRANQQVQSEMLDRIQYEAEARKEVNAHRTQLLMRIDGLENRLCLADAENERKSVELEHLQAQTTMLMKEISSLQDAAAATTRAQVMIAELEGELEAQKEFYETQILQHTKAMELMQISHSEEKRQLFAMMGPRENNANIIRKQRKGAKRTHENQADKHGGEGNKAEGKAVAADTAAEKKGTATTTKQKQQQVVVDALQLMKLNAAMAEKCALSIGHV